jgi:4-hydroxy-tetrahydrodipicolinate reductase
MTVRIAITGAAGRMGRALARAAAEREGVTITAAVDRPGAPDLGADLGLLAGLGAAGVAVTDDPASAAAVADVIIDFSTPAATRALVAATRLPLVIGTTGFTAEDEAAIAAAATDRAIVRSGNFSLGVNLIAAMARRAAAILGPDWDIEIIEAHHRRKVDAPSGTALLLGEAAAAGRGAALQDLRLAPHDGVTGPRRKGGIGFAVIRAGGVVGDHDVIFAAEDEIVTLSHRAGDRAIFARGALAAAAWAVGKPPGLYGMADVIGEIG